ncbi:MAG: hypothetical protein H6721_29070 [Sandaracinus sp.]|nr:hypothetical protein [Sandaracinus sp.]
MVFDERRLSHRLDDSCDWWAIESEEIAEVNAGNALFVGLEADGAYEVRSWQVFGEEEREWPVRALIACDSGSLLIGPGECVPGGGVSPRRDEVLRLDVEPGVYAVLVAPRGPHAIDVGYCLVDETATNRVSHGLSLVRGSTEPRGRVSDWYVPSAVQLGAALNRPVDELVDRLPLVQGVRSMDDGIVTYSYVDVGLELCVDGGRLVYVHLYDECEATRLRDAYSKYPGDLPCGLAFGRSKEEVVRVLGPPFKDSAFFSLWFVAGMAYRAAFERGRLRSFNLVSLESPIARGLLASS